jgi:hypothetical protein
MDVTATALASATIAPTDTSMPRAMMTKVIPTATMPTAEVCKRMLLRLPSVRKTGDAIETTTTRIRKAK